MWFDKSRLEANITWRTGTSRDVLFMLLPKAYDRFKIFW